MKKLMVLFVMCMAVTAAAKKQNMKNPPARVDTPLFKSGEAAVDNSRPEPSGVYGYISVVDPATNRRYVSDPRANASARGSGLSFPVYVVFRGTNNPSQTTRIQWPSGFAYYRNPPQAVWYSFGFMQDSSAGNNPAFNYRDGKLHYDPAKWRFLRIETDGIHWQEMADNGAFTDVTVPVSAVPPIADFPDFRGDPMGPR